MKKKNISISMICFFFCACNQVQTAEKNRKDTISLLPAQLADTLKEVSDSFQMNKLIKEYELYQADTVDLGDINADGKKDKAIIQPVTFIFKDKRINDQYVNINFTCNFPALTHHDGFKGILVNVGDLDGNGTAELLYYPDWYQSNSAIYYIYSYKQNKWVLLTSTFLRRDAVREQKDPETFLKSRIIKINNKSFKSRGQVWKDGDLVGETKIVSTQ